MENEETECGGCPLGDASRRAFLADGARIAGAVLLALGAGSARGLAALEVRSGTGRRGTAGTVTYPVPASDGVTIDKANQVMLARAGRSLYAFALACPHQNTAVRWLDKEGRFQCPKHKSKYRPDGTFIEGRATRALDRYQVSLSGSDIVVDLTRAYHQDENAAAWAAAVATV